MGLWCGQSDYGERDDCNDSAHLAQAVDQPTNVGLPSQVDFGRDAIARALKILFFKSRFTPAGSVEARTQRLSAAPLASKASTITPQRPNFVQRQNWR